MTAPAPSATAKVDFSARARLPEMMDADDLPAATYADVIGGLAGVNTITLARLPTLAWLEKATRGMTGFSLVDVGFGHGDMLRAIAKWAKKRGLAARLTGVDLNPKSAPVAAAATDPTLGIDYVTGDAAALGFAPDFIVSSLVAHHMEDAELVGFLRWMEATATRGWFINDLHRNRIAWLGFRLLGGVFRWHLIVRHDGALSVRRAFVRRDWDGLLAAAGLAQPPVSVRWHIPFRWGVGRLK
jgi:2-polyprenyl-3-methyl-5-hydroxy-6-metoxy-1,4-benzoquinol methylase